MSISTPVRILSLLLFLSIGSFAQSDTSLRKKDRKKDVRFMTTQGVLVLRLSDSTPLHRDNFLKLVKTGYYDSTLFHRVIKNFMIQGGDPNSRKAPAGQPLGNGGPTERIPAEFNPTLFHKRGVLAAARDNNPARPAAAANSTSYTEKPSPMQDWTPWKPSAWKEERFPSPTGKFIKPLAVLLTSTRTTRFSVNW